MRLLRVLGLWAGLLTALALPGTGFAQPTASSAQRLANLEAAVSALTTDVTNLKAENAAQASLLQSQAAAISALNAALAQQSSSLTALQAALSKEIADRKLYADAVGASTLASAKAYSDGTLASAKTYADGKVAPVADKLIHFSRAGNEVYITGANLNIRSGSGLTYSYGVNGLGNLIVGYNELRSGTGAVNTRTGSHNLIIGLHNNYSSAGAIVAGSDNTSTNYMASVYGGTGNTSGGYYSAVVGGYNNSATGNWSTILGGRDVTAPNQLDHKP